MITAFCPTARANMDTALLTTVEQLSDDMPHSRAEFAGLWPSESPLAAPIQPSAAPLSRSLVTDLRDGQNGAMEPVERYELLT